MGNLVASGELNKALQPVFGKIPNVHLIHDDMIIAAQTLKEHDNTVEAVLSKAFEWVSPLIQRKAYLMPKKYHSGE